MLGGGALARGGCMRIALLGVGRMGSELIRRTLDDPNYRFVAIGDTSGVIANHDAFSKNNMIDILTLKQKGGRLKDYKGEHDYHESMSSALDRCDVDVLVDVTDAQTYDLLMKALEQAHVVVSNKIPIADISYAKFQRLISKAKEQRRILDFGTTVGAGLKIPDLIRRLGIDGIDLVSGCLSGTMNYVSQRLNEGAPLSVALREAMEPPRSYTEPDPRTDLGGEDFARKLVIIGRICGREVERVMVDVEDIVTDELRALSVDEFLEKLPVLDSEIGRRAEDAKWDANRIWYLGTADLQNDEYCVRFEEIPVGDPITRAKESDNVLTIYPRRWRRPVTIIGPGAGAHETVTGLISGLSYILPSCF